MNILSSLFQPDKSALSPIARAFVGWLEIMVISVPAAVGVAGLDYLNQRPGDIVGMLPFLGSAIVIAVLKSLTMLVVSGKPVQVVTSPSAPTPIVIHNNMPPIPPSATVPAQPAQTQPVPATLTTQISPTSNATASATALPST